MVVVVVVVTGLPHPPRHVWHVAQRRHRRRRRHGTRRADDGAQRHRHGRRWCTASCAGCAGCCCAASTRYTCVSEGSPLASCHVTRRCSARRSPPSRLDSLSPLVVASRETRHAPSCHVTRRVHLSLRDARKKKNRTTRILSLSALRRVASSRARRAPPPPLARSVWGRAARVCV